MIPLSIPRNPSPRSFPLHVPTRLIQAFKQLDTDPILTGGSAVQVWTGRVDRLFQTHDLDFITSIALRDLATVGIALEISGRHALVDGVAVEFPSGPLAVAHLHLDPARDTVLVPTFEGDQIRRIRPEACALDRLAQTAGWGVSETFLQAAAVVATQAATPSWDQTWIDLAAEKAGLAGIWTHLKQVMERGHPTEADLAVALHIGLDPCHPSH